MKKNLQMAEDMIRAVVKTAGVQGLAVALHNAFVHGEILPDVDDQAVLDLIFSGIEKIGAAATLLNR